jgi:hypothetical protein
MYSYTSSLGATGRSVGRSSVPKDRTARLRSSLIYTEFRANLFLTFGQGDRGHLGVDGVEDAFIPDLRFGDQADLGPQVGDPCRHCGSLVQSPFAQIAENLHISLCWLTIPSSKMEDTDQTGCHSHRGRFGVVAGRRRFNFTKTRENVKRISLDNINSIIKQSMFDER